MYLETTKDRGRAGFLAGIAYFGANGYTVSLPLNDTQYYDFVAEKDGRFYTVQCKAALNNDVHLYGRSYNIIDDGVDFLFCLGSGKVTYCIPVKELDQYGNGRSITLRTKPNKHDRKDAFPSWKYIVCI